MNSARTATAPQAADDLLGQLEEVWIWLEEGLRAYIERLHEERGLVPAFHEDREVGTEVEERNLEDLGTRADRLAEPVGETGALVRGSGLGSANIHLSC